MRSSNCVRRSICYRSARSTFRIRWTSKMALRGSLLAPTKQVGPFYRSPWQLKTVPEPSLDDGTYHAEEAVRSADFKFETAAKAALRRKKTYEHALEQTSAQMMTVEREISSIETANINKETLDAMKNASSAMKQIHGGLTIDKVDATMYVYLQANVCYATLFTHSPLTFQLYHHNLQSLTMQKQGRPPRTACHRRGNRRSPHARRRRVRRRRG